MFKALDSAFPSHDVCPMGADSFSLERTAFLVSTAGSYFGGLPERGRPLRL
jgi:hypothetical protein